MTLGFSGGPTHIHSRSCFAHRWPCPSLSIAAASAVAWSWCVSAAARAYSSWRNRIPAVPCRADGTARPDRHRHTITTEQPNAFAIVAVRNPDPATISSGDLPATVSGTARRGPGCRRVTGRTRGAAAATTAATR
jgi:hypothetical protein